MTKDELKKLLPKGVDERTLAKVVEKLEEEARKAASAAQAQKRDYDELLEKYERDMQGAQEAAFEAELDKALIRRGARSIKAAKAMLDVEKLRKSENRAEEIRKAVEALASGEEGAFLFMPEKTGRRMHIGGGRFKNAVQGGEAAAIRRAAGLK